MTKNKVTLCIFANFHIDNEERLQRMKDSFLSFKDCIPDEWKINIRGKLRLKAGSFILSHIKNNVSIFYIDSNKGWFQDSFSYATYIKSEYIFFWIEDHISLIKPNLIREIIKEMKIFNVDQLRYSFINQDSIEIFKMFPLINKGDHINVVNVRDENIKNTVKEASRNFYIISAVGIFKKNFFFEILLSKKPYLKRWSKYLPFDFEKKALDRVFKNMIFAFPNKEIFASIDDDAGINGYSLIKRGLYPNRMSRSDLKKKELLDDNSIIKKISKFLPKSFYFFLKPIYKIILRIIYTYQHYT